MTSSLGLRRGGYQHALQAPQFVELSLAVGHRVLLFPLDNIGAFRLHVNQNSRIRVSMTKEQVIKLLRSACDRAGSQANWAKAHGIAPAYVNDVLNERREPGDKILDALGIERTYRRKRRSHPDG